MKNNYFQLKGNLAKDPIIIKKGSPKPFVGFVVAINDVKRNTVFLDVISWDEKTIKCLGNTKKGQFVFAEGYIANYKVKDGEYKTRLVADFARPFEQETKKEKQIIDDVEDVGFEIDEEEYQGYSYE